MAEITSTVVERLDLSDVLRKLAEQKKAEAALAAQSTALGVSKRDLVKAINAQEKALDQAVVAELQAAKQSIAASERKAAAAAREAAALEKRNAAAKQRADEKAYLFSVRAASEEAERLAKAQSMANASMAAGSASTGALSAATGNLRAQFIDLGVQLQGGASPLTALSQQLPQIAEAAMGTTGAMGSFVSAVGAAAIPAGLLLTAVSPLIPMYLDYKAAAKEAADSQKFWNEQADVGVQHSTMVRDALTDALIATGVYSDEQGENVKIEQKWDEALRMGTADLWDRKRVLDAQIAGGEELAALNRERLAQGLEEVEQARVSGPIYEEVKKQLDETNAAIDERTRNNEIGREADIKAAKARRDGAEADRIEAEAARDAAKARKEKTKANEEEMVTLEDIIEQEERMADQERRLAEQSARLREQQVNDWVEGVEKQHAAEVRAAEESAKLAAGRRSALLGVTEDLASVAADAFGAESAVAKAAALIQVAIAEAEVLAKAATLGPIAGPIYAGIGTASVAIAASQIKAINPNIESYNDTPAMQRRTFGPSGGMVKFAPGDTVDFAAARRPSDLARQTGGSGPSQVSTTIKLQVAGRTAQTITALAENTRRGRPPGSPIPGRRSWR